MHLGPVLLAVELSFGYHLSLSDLGLVLATVEVGLPSFFANHLFVADLAYEALPAFLLLLLFEAHLLTDLQFKLFHVVLLIVVELVLHEFEGLIQSKSLVVLSRVELNQLEVLRELILNASREPAGLVLSVLLGLDH